MLSSLTPRYCEVSTGLSLTSCWFLFTSSIGNHVNESNVKFDCSSKSSKLSEMWDEVVIPMELNVGGWSGQRRRGRFHSNASGATSISGAPDERLSVISGTLPGEDASHWDGMLSHHITSLYIALHCIASHHITSHHITSHCISLHHITSHHITLHHIVSHCIASHCNTSHRIALHCIALDCIASHHITSHCITLHCITLHRIMSHCITLHRIT